MHFIFIGIQNLQYKADLQGFISQQLSLYGLHITDDILDDAERKQESAKKLILIKSYRAKQRSLRNTNKIIRLTEKYQSEAKSPEIVRRYRYPNKEKILLFAVLDFGHKT